MSKSSKKTELNGIKKALIAIFTILFLMLSLRLVVRRKNGN